METTWGYHYHYDVTGCDSDAMKSKETVTRFIKDLVKRIDMVPIGEPYVEYIAMDQEDKAGITAVQVIVTSTITAHFIDSTGDLYLDVFSCKPYDVNTVKEIVKEYFNPTKCVELFMTRQAPR